jgi:hypothetical protein
VLQREEGTAQVELEAGNSPQMIFQHYLELVRPKDVKIWFSITPGEDGQMVCIEVPKGGEKASDERAKAEAVAAVVVVAAVI